MENKQHKIFLLLSLIIFICSITFMILNIKIPEYGGDEIWFAVNLLYKKIADLTVFEFVYSGPIKTILTYPIFKQLGFNIISVRLFSICSYIITVILWSSFLYKKRLFTALGTSLILFSLNADLIYFAKTDINQPTFHNLFFATHLIIFLYLLKNNRSVIINYGFVVLALVESNLHIRNIWIMNAFLFTYIFNFFLFEKKKFSLINKIKNLLLLGWPVFIGWTASTLYYLYTIEHFKNDPSIITAKNLGGNITIFDCIIRSVMNICNYVVGGRIFSTAFSTSHQAYFPLITGILFLIAITIFGSIIISKIDRNKYSNYLKITIAISTITVLISIQYSITKSSIHPWHGNHFLLLWVLIFGLIIEGLMIINYKTVAKLTLITMSGILVLMNIYNYEGTHKHDSTKIGWAVVFQPYNLDPIRQYISDHPDNYIVADWEIGRPLGLENYYLKDKRSTVQFVSANMSEEIILYLSGKIAIRSTNITQTVPDWSDKELAKFNAKFESISVFKDEMGREIYQVGYIRKNNK